MKCKKVNIVFACFLFIAGMTANGQSGFSVSVEQTTKPVAVTFVFKAPGQDERIDKEVQPPEGTNWLTVSITLKGNQKGSCEVDRIAVKTLAGETFAATGISTEPKNGFIKLQDIPLGVGRGPAAWSVFRGSSGSVRLSVLDADPHFHLLFSIPKAVTPSTIEVCTFGSAKVVATK